MSESHRCKPEQGRTDAARGSASPAGEVFAIIGLLWQSTLLYGFAQFIPLMLGTFRAITESGIADPKVMAEGIGKALVPVVIWGAVGVFGLLTTLVTMLVSHYRASWWFWASSTFAIVYLLFVPVGTVLGIALLVVLMLKRREFFRSSSATESAA